VHPILFEILDFPIGTYALMAIVGVASGLWLFSWLAGRDGHSRVAIVEIGLWAFIIGLFSSKIFGAIVDFEPANPWRSVWNALRFGGYYYIGFIASVGYGVFAFRQLRIPLAKGLDYVVPAVALAHGFGRIGCLLAGCCWGTPCDLPWAVTFTTDQIHTGVPIDTPLHPTQAYEALAEFVIAALLTWKAIKRPWHAGSTFLGYVALYGATRFAIEFVRGDERGMFLGYPMSRPLALGSVVVAVGLLAYLSTRRAPRPQVTVESTDPRPGEVSATHPSARREKRKNRR
jgi:phosphatidylglycerol:prolipoprotein diacylglycerol transferase